MTLPFPDFSYLIQVVNVGFDMEVFTFSPAGMMSYSSLVGIHRFFQPLLRLVAVYLSAEAFAYMFWHLKFVLNFPLRAEINC